MITKIVASLVVLLGLFAVSTQVNLGSSHRIPDDELLKSDVENILASRLEGGVVQYSYKDLTQEILWEKDEYKKTPHSRHYKAGQRVIDGVLHNVEITKIIAGLPQYHQEPDKKWYQIEYATTTEDSFERQTAYVPSSILWQTVYAATFQEFSVPKDGYVGELTNALWTTMIDDVGDTNGASSSDSGVGMARIGSAVGCSGSGTWDIMTKGMFPFDTTSIATDQEVSSSTLDIRVSNDNIQDTYAQSVEVVERDNIGTTLKSTDYEKAKFGTVSFAAVDVSSITKNTHVIFTMNASGRTFIEDQIQAGTSTILATMMTAQISEVEPSCGSDQSAQVGAYFSERAGTASDPVLTIVHVSPAGGEATLQIRGTRNFINNL